MKCFKESKLLTTVLLVTQVPTVIVPITQEAVMEALACATVKQILAAVAMRLVAPVITVIIAVTLQLLGDAEPAGTQEALAPSTE